MEELLARPGQPVLVVEHALETASQTVERLCGLAPWCEHQRVPTTGPPRLVVSSTEVPPITFIGAIEGRLVEAFATLLAELSLDAPDFDTPATPARLGELWPLYGGSGSDRGADVVAVVTPTCPACPAVLDAVLRFAQAKAPLRVTVVRPEWLEGRKVTSTPSILADNALVASGVMGEYALADRLVTALSSRYLTATRSVPLRPR